MDGVLRRFPGTDGETGVVGRSVEALRRPDLDQATSVDLVRGGGPDPAGEGSSCCQERLAFRQLVDQRRTPLGIELGEDVIEEEEWCRARTHRGEIVHGKAQSDRQAPLFPL